MSTQSDAALVTDETRLETNEAEVAAKVYDDEVVLLHLSTGVYGSIERFGGLIWEAIEKRCSVREIAALLAARCGVSPERPLADVRQLAAQLVAEQLARPSAGPSAEASPRAPLDPAPAGAPVAYEPPCLVVYRDMEDLLALDPPLPEYVAAPWKGR